MTDTSKLPKTGGSFVRLPDGTLVSEAEAKKTAKAATRSDAKSGPKKESKNA